MLKTRLDRKGLETLAESGFLALKITPISKMLKVTKGSFYWHFDDLESFHAELLSAWQTRSTEQIMAQTNSATIPEEKIDVLMQRIFLMDDRLDRAVRDWSRFDANVESQIRAVDSLRLDFVVSLLVEAGLPQRIAIVRGKLVYAASLGVHRIRVNDKPLIGKADIAALTDFLKLGRAGRAPLTH